MIATSPQTETPIAVKPSARKKSARPKSTASEEYLGAEPVQADGTLEAGSDDPMTKGVKDDSPPPAASSPASNVERVSSAGLIRIENEAAVAAIPLYYYAERCKWYGPSGNGGFANYSDSQAKNIIAEHGFNKSVRDSQGNTPAERAMLWLIQNHSVAYAGPLAGYKSGVLGAGAWRILVTESPRLILPDPGPCAIIRKLVESMLKDEAHDQVSVFYLWASEGLSAYWDRLNNPESWRFRHSPALAIFGPRGCGKTALIDLVLSRLFGGRKSDPMNFLRDPKFNKDLFAASLLVLDDKGASANLAERRQRGEGIKDLIWKPEQRMEGKGADAIMLKPFWRLVIAGNDDEAGLQVCPALSPSLEDKLILLRASQADGLPETHDENDLWARQIEKELPHFAAFLLAWKPPETLRVDPRTRIANFWHPEIKSCLRNLQPEMRLLELIDSLGLIDADAPLWQGTASDFERTMRQKDQEKMLDRVFISSMGAGRMLVELSRMSPDRVNRTNRGNQNYYRIFRPPSRPGSEPVDGVTPA